jgi:hypothetical protein
MPAVTPTSGRHTPLPPGTPSVEETLPSDPALGASPTTFPSKPETTAPRQSSQAGDAGPVSTSPATTTPPTTEAPAPPPQLEFPPVGAGHTRFIIVVDDAGVHAPASFPAGPAVEIIFIDIRSKHAALSCLISTGGVFLLHWDDQEDPIPAWKIKPGVATFTVWDDVPAMQFTINFTAP